jgi:lipopolysaccharide transport system ATP-binding protein
MTSVAVRTEGLGKQYRIGRVQARYETLRDTIADSARDAVRALQTLYRPTLREQRAQPIIWALQDVTFDVRRGGVTGIIGRNGAGKSTLLKILARITRPTTGEAEVHGRLGSLLEVGTGFHPELTGRENVYLSGSILGMTRSEIRSKFDEMVAFAEVEEFIDTAVKHYSSGMYMRLAFSVAAFLEPDVLVVDEVLAVGDAEFQNKCLGRMDDVAKDGRTVLFVSHNMAAIRRLCDTCLLLDKGRVSAFGETSDVVGSYLSRGANRSPAAAWIDLSTESRSRTGIARFVALRYSSLNESVGFQPFQRGPLEFDLTIASQVQTAGVNIAVSIRDPYGTKLINADTDTIGARIVLRPGQSTWRLCIESLYLKPGVYTVGLWLADRVGAVIDRIGVACQIEVVDIDPPPIGTRVEPRYDGVVTCRFSLHAIP